ncbi:MAG: glycosyltransferase, partial [Chloroflexales bacterium]|nr:glycosyltransferase [Chloroflexales bacterium]
PLPYAPLPAVEHRTTPGDLVYFGRLEARKGVFELAQACAALWQRGHTFTLTLIGGDGPFAPQGQTMGQFLRARFRRWVEAGKLVITGEPLPPPALWQRLAQAHAVLVPSRWENFPNACIEAMSLGIPVVASTSGGQAELVGNDRRCGLLFDWDKPGDCESAIERVLALGQAELAAMGQAASERARALTSFEAVLPQREAHFAQMIAAGAGSSRSFPCVTPGITGNALPPDPASVPGLLSVVVPLYEAGMHVEKSITGIVASGYRPLEVLVVDDGHSDEASVTAIAGLQARHADLIRVHRIASQGLAAARNAGADLARGEFVAFVGADDLVEPVFFARAIGVLRRYANASFVYSWVRFFGEHDGCWPTFNTELPYLLAHNMLTAMAMVRRADFLAYGRNSAELPYAMEDYDGWLGMLEAGCVGISLPDMLVRYRMRAGSMLRQMGDDQALYLADVIARRHPALYRRFGEELFGLLNANGRSYQWNHPAVANDAPDTPPLRRYIADLQAQHRQLDAMWHQQQEALAQQQAQLDALRHPLGYWRGVVRPRLGRLARRLRGK